MPNQEDLVSHLRRDDAAKWNEVFVWFAKNWYDLYSKSRSQNEAFLKELMLAIAENIAVTFADTQYRIFPLMLAAIFDHADSILALIKRGAEVHQQDDNGRTALHVGAAYGNMNVCETLLEHNANINAADHFGDTPLMFAKDKKVHSADVLIGKGANKNIISKICSKLEKFQQR